MKYPNTAKYCTSSPSTLHLHCISNCTGAKGDNAVKQIFACHTYIKSFHYYNKPRHSKTYNIALYSITKTCLYNFDPLKPHFYIVKLGFTGVYIVFHISAQNIDCGYLLEPPRRGSSNEYPQSMCRNMKNIKTFYLNIFIFLVVKFSIYLNRHVFVMNNKRSRVVVWSVQCSCLGSEHTILGPPNIYIPKL